MNKKIETPNAPQAIGPYSQAIQAGNFLFVSGQVAIDPATGDIVAGGIEAQTDRVLKNVTAIIEAAGMSSHIASPACRCRMWSSAPAF